MYNPARKLYLRNSNLKHQQPQIRYKEPIRNKFQEKSDNNITLMSCQMVT